VPGHARIGLPGAANRALFRGDRRLDSFEVEGIGPIAAFVHALTSDVAPTFEITHYSEHALGSGSDASAIANLQIKTAGGKKTFGASVDTSIELAGIDAVLSALNRMS